MIFEQKVVALQELGIEFWAKNCTKRGECFRLSSKGQAMPSDAELEAALTKHETRLAVAAEVDKIRAAREAEQLAADEAEAKRRLGL